MSSYLKRLGLDRPAYDKQPFIPVSGFDDACRRGWEEICSELRRATAASNRRKTIVAIECYGGVLDRELIPALRTGLRPVAFHVTTDSVFKSPEEIDRLCASDLGGDDPVFGQMTRLELADFISPSRVRTLAEAIAAIESGCVVVYGPGASLCCEPDVFVYADLARWEIQQRQRRSEVGNLGVPNHDLKASLQYKRAYFIDWRVLDERKRQTFDAWDYLLDTNTEDDPKLIPGEAFRAAMREAVRRPFRVVPFFDPGPWGGQWMKEVCDLDPGQQNFAWCFDCVPEENSLLLGFGGTRVEIPAIDVVLCQPEGLLGEPVYGRFGAEFPIRFDFLDTMQGGNLSFQVHPSVDYARRHFGIPYTQDESYYILDCEEDAMVYLGFKKGADPEAMFADLERAQADPDRGFPDEKHAARWRARRHDHFLIPAGTIHCSGTNCMVLEISHTPYIFTFKLWDWGRLGLDGKPRPINIERGRHVVRPERDEPWVRERLVNPVEPIGSGDGWREERTGLYRSELIETRRHWFTGTVPHDTRGESVHVLNLVQGAEAIVESPSGAFEPFAVHFAETFIIPAAVGAYTIRPAEKDPGKEHATIRASVRASAG